MLEPALAATDLLLCCAEHWSNCPLTAFGMCAGQARIIMRQRGNLRLLLNANLWEDMAVNVMDGALGVTFAVHNAAVQQVYA